MELYALQVFLTVATEKSFSRAAEKLFRTQPAVSLAVQRLEPELGEKLIDRSGARSWSSPTPAAPCSSTRAASRTSSRSWTTRSPSCATTRRGG